MATDISLSSPAQLFALIAEDNVTTIGSLVIGDVSFGAPAVNNTGGGVGDTDVVVTAVANSGYSGNVTVNYNRIDLADFSTIGPALEVTVGEGATVEDIVAAFNAQFGSNLDATDYDSGLSAPVPDDDGEPFTLVANATSLAYRGQISITVYLDSVALSTIITNTSLNGLELPA